MGARAIGPEVAKSIVDVWLASEFDPAGSSAENVKAIDKLDEFSKSTPEDLVGAFRAAAAAAEAAIESTRNWPAKRGRQSYAGDRTIGTLDPGIVAVAMMMKATVAALESNYGA